MKKLVVISLLSVFAISSAQAQNFDPNAYYRLSTQFRGGGMCLDVFNGGSKNNMTHLTRCADLSGQYWRLQAIGNGYYKMKTMFRGNNMCLDVFNGGPNNNQVHLTNCANYSGQSWRLQANGGWYRLTTQFRGTNMCLDIFNGGANNNQPHLTNCANYSGQYWKVANSGKRIASAPQPAPRASTPPRNTAQGLPQKQQRQAAARTVNVPTNRNVYLRVSDAPLYIHTWGGSRPGNAQNLHPCPKQNNHGNCQWRFERSTTRPGAYYIRASDQNLYLHANGGTRNGAKETLHACPKQNNHANCQWYVESSSSRRGAVYIKSAGGPLYIHASGGSRKDANQTLHSCPKQSNYGHCQWIIE